jgi:hypothetical protein
MYYNKVHIVDSFKALVYRFQKEQMKSVGSKVLVHDGEYVKSVVSAVN